MPMNLAILPLLTNILSTLQADHYCIMAKNSPTINFMVAQFFMMLLLVLFGLRINSHLELEKLWWLRNALNNGYGKLLLNFATFIMAIESSMLSFLLRTARTSSIMSHFLKLVLIIKFPFLSGQFKPLCTWPRPSWFMFLCTEANIMLIILNFGSLPRNMLFGLSITFLTVSLVWHHTNYSTKSRSIIVILFVLIYGDSQSMSLIQRYIMVNKFLSGIINHIWTIFWVSVMNILLQSPMSATYLMVMCDKSITWFSISNNGV